eukprot:365771-Chlamydomonas_euryale.AAC.7
MVGNFRSQGSMIRDIKSQESGMSKPLFSNRGLGRQHSVGRCIAGCVASSRIFRLPGSLATFGFKGPTRTSADLGNASSNKLLNPHHRSGSKRTSG